MSQLTKENALKQIELYGLFLQVVDLIPQPDSDVPGHAEMYTELIQYGDGQGRIKDCDVDVCWFSLDDGIVTLRKLVMYLQKNPYNYETTLIWKAVMNVVVAHE